MKVIQSVIGIRYGITSKGKSDGKTIFIEKDRKYYLNQIKMDSIEIN